MTTSNIIVDGNSIIKFLNLTHPNTSNKKNSYDLVIYNFVNHVRDLLNLYKPNNVCVIMPKNIDMEQNKISAINDIVTSMGLKTVFIDDNQIGDTVSNLIKNFLIHNNNEIIISSKSLALTQFITNKTKYKYFGSSDFLTEETLNASIGIELGQIPDFIAMCGDQTIGLKSVIGSNTAISWLKKYGNLDEIIKHQDKLQRAMQDVFKKNIEKIKEQRIFSRFENDLISKNINITDIKRIKINAKNLYDKYIEHKLYQWLPPELAKMHQPKTNFDSNMTFISEIDSYSDIDNLKKILQLKKSCAVYVEGEYMAIASEIGRSFILNLNNKEIHDFIKDEFCKKDLKIIVHNEKKIRKILEKKEIFCENIFSDSALLSYTINSAFAEATLDELAKSINITMPTFSNETEKKIRFLGEMADIILRVNRNLYKQASNDIIARRIFEEQELPLQKVIFDMEKNGFLLDVEKLKEIGSEIDERLIFITNQISQTAKKRINVGLSSDIVDYLQNTLQISLNKKTKTGRITVNEETLSSITEKHPTIKMILEYRSLSTLKSTYIKGILDKVNKETNRIHTNFMQNVTRTTRLSSRDANLQNIPIRTDEGKKIRQCFISNKNNYVLAADYSQIELRVLAHLSKDKKLIEAFASGVDIHKATASEIFDIPLTDVTGKQRRFAKSINFGLVYGMSAYGLSQKLGISVEDSALYIKKYFRKYPQVEKYQKELLENARKTGYITTILGRKIYYKNLKNPNENLRKAAERAAINAPMQGSASEIIKKAMILSSLFLKENNLKSKLLLQVHDELVFEVPKNELKFVYNNILKIMSNAIPMDVPLIVEGDVGLNWESSHSLDKVKTQDNLENGMIL